MNSWHRTIQRSPVNSWHRTIQRSPVNSWHRTRQRSPVNSWHRTIQRSPVNSWHRTIQRSPVKTFEKPFIWTLYSQPTEIWDDWVVPKHHLTVILKCLHSWSVVSHTSHASLFVVEVPTELTVRSYPTKPCLLHPQALCQWASCYRIVWSVQVVLSLTNYMTWHGVSQMRPGLSDHLWLWEANKLILSKSYTQGFS